MSAAAAQGLAVARPGVTVLLALAACNDERGAIGGVPPDARDLAADLDAGRATADAARPDAPAPDAPACPRRPADPPDGDCADDCYDRLGPRLLAAIDVAALGLPPADPGAAPVRVGVFVTTSPHQPIAPWTEDEAAGAIGRMVQQAGAVLAQCAARIEVEAAQVVALPARLLDIQGNQEGSWGGHPPPGTPDPDRFNYDQNERLTDEARELFAYGKEHTSPNGIAAFTVRYVTYWAEQQLTAAGGLSFPPNDFHHPDDYPLRNSVLMVPGYGACGSLPRLQHGAVFAHELGHMLLNSGLHVSDPRNLMGGGTALTADQCARIRDNLDRLFGEDAVADPGPPVAE